MTKYCCRDFKITKQDYKHISGTKKWGFRFTGHFMIFCPFCGKRIWRD